MLKVVSFSLNAFIARYTSMADFGKLTMQYQLILALALTVLKEGYRKGAIREGEIVSAKKIIANGIFVTFFLSIATLIGTYILHPEPVLVLLTILLALLIESVAEFGLVEEIILRDNLAIKSTGEMWATFSKSVLLVSALVSGLTPAWAFAVSQLAYAVTWYRIVAIRTSISTLSGTLNWTCLYGGIQKLLIDEGERMVAVTCLDSVSLGQLGLVRNLGSLAIRLVLGPLEEIGYNTFSKNKKSSNLLFPTFFLIAVSVGSFAALFGPVSVRPVLLVLYGSRWAGDDQVVLMLQLFCGLVLLFAVAGTLESYVHATGDDRVVRQVLITQSVAFVATVSVMAATVKSLGPLAALLGVAVSLIVRIIRFMSTIQGVVIHPELSNVMKRIFLGAGLCYTVIVWIGSDRASVVLGMSATFAIATVSSVYPLIRAATRVAFKNQD